MPHLVVAPDKFRGTAAAGEVAEAISRAGVAAGWSTAAVAMADGGEGTLDALGGRPRRLVVQDPLGRPVEAEWRLLEAGLDPDRLDPDRLDRDRLDRDRLDRDRLDGGGAPTWVSGRGRGPTAVVEMARASGLALVGGPEGNDPMAASTTGTGQLIVAALAAGAGRVVVACGGSATTDGGLGVVEALGAERRPGRADLVVACDVDTLFVDAAATFAPQKGASPAQVALLTRRLERLAQLYEARHGVDVRPLPGGGAAGGLAGGLAAIGARLVPGFDLVAQAHGLAGLVAMADLVVTGEGFLDEQSFHGKVVGGVVGLARAAGVPTLVVVGDAAPEAVAEAGEGVMVVSLVAAVGRDRALADPLAGVQALVGAHLAGLGA